MIQRMLRWLSPLATLTLATLPAQAQSSDSDIHRTGALGYVIAFMFTLLVLVILCAPTRKSLRDRE
jgi:hypothetical protein